MTGVLTNKTKLSIVVPVLNERDCIATFIKHLKTQWCQPQELIFVDGGSTDGTWEWLQKQDVTAYRSPQGRAVQMNAGAEQASGNLYYFIHVDSTLPYHFDQTLLEAHNAGSFSGLFSIGI
jgi:glycosyltransferase involved in cell wall biosynthesis